MRTYEGMFLLDAGNPDFESASAPVRDLLARVQAEVLALKPWDERRLAYEIRGRRRGLYVLTYFRADPAKVAELQHDVQLDERILRALVLSADHVSAEQMQAETPATQASARRARRAAEKAAEKAYEVLPRILKDKGYDKKLQERGTLVPTEVANLRMAIREEIRDLLDQIDELVLNLLSDTKTDTETKLDMFNLNQKHKKG